MLMRDLKCTGNTSEAEHAKEEPKTPKFFFLFAGTV